MLYFFLPEDAQILKGKPKDWSSVKALKANSSPELCVWPFHLGRKYKKWAPDNLGQNWWKVSFRFSLLHIHDEFRNCLHQLYF